MEFEDIVQICPKCGDPLFGLTSKRGTKVCMNCSTIVFIRKTAVWEDLKRAAIQFKKEMDKDFDVDLTLKEIRMVLVEGDNK
jgi:uncharacterized Zn finger protein (UPF0148 family)